MKNRLSARQYRCIELELSKNGRNSFKGGTVDKIPSPSRSCSEKEIKKDWKIAKLPHICKSGIGGGVDKMQLVFASVVYVVVPSSSTAPRELITRYKEPRCLAKQ